MKKSLNNFLFVVLDGLSSDLLFWIVIQNLFLTSFKSLSSFRVVLMTFVGGGACLLIYPLLMIVISKIKRYYCSIISNFLLLLSIVLFTVCNTIYGFFIAQ